MAQAALGQTVVVKPALERDEALPITSRLSSQQRFEGMTMKALTIKALDQHLTNGATTKELIIFFEDAWGRKIKRESLSPQLSRLRSEGVIGRQSQRWFLKQHLASEVK